MSAGRLLAISDLHVGHEANRKIADELAATHPEDWLIVCGDVGDQPATVREVLAGLVERFAKVLWVPGNHELLTYPGETPELRGEQRYRHYVAICRELGVVSPEDPYPVWHGEGGPALVVPLFLLYDYSFGRNIAPTKAQALQRAHDAGVVCVDEFLLHPDPYPSREAWCHARVAATEQRLAARPPGMPTVLVNHFPLIDAPTRVLWHPEFAQWCGTLRTADWHRRFDAAAVVYGHLHIPRTTRHDGVPFEEVSLGYPREWSRRRLAPRVPRQILPRPEAR